MFYFYFIFTLLHHNRRDLDGMAVYKYLVVCMYVCMFSSKDNKKRFWSFVRSRKRSPTPLSFKHGAQTLVNPHEIACAFNTYFASVFFC